jgi:hypothetical protein
MITSTLDARPEILARPEPTARTAEGGARLTRLSARFGLAFAICQLAVMVCMAILVLPHGGSPSTPALERGRGVLDAENLYRPAGQLRVHTRRDAAGRLSRRRVREAAEG